MKKQLKRYGFSLAAAAALVALLLFYPETGAVALDTTLYSFQEMAFIIPPIFILLGLLDVWMPRETMVKYLGEGSGLKGMLLAVLLGSAVAGPLYAAFPVAAVFMKKGAKFFNVILFIGAWSTTRVPMLLFELSSMGARFMLTRLVLSLTGITIIAFIVDKTMSRDEVEKIYERANQL